MQHRQMLWLGCGLIINHKSYSSVSENFSVLEKTDPFASPHNWCETSDRAGSELPLPCSRREPGHCCTGYCANIWPRGSRCHREFRHEALEKVGAAERIIRQPDQPEKQQLIKPRAWSLPRLAHSPQQDHKGFANKTPSRELAVWIDGVFCLQPYRKWDWRGV